MKAKLLIINCGHGYWTWLFLLGRYDRVDTANSYPTAKATKRRALTVAKKLGLTITKVEGG